MRERHSADRYFRRALSLPGLGSLLLLFSVAYFLWLGSKFALDHFGTDLITRSTWDPVAEIFGALPVIYGTLVSSGIAILIATPLSICAALFLTELAPKKVSAALGFAIEMLAAIPSVIYGLWGIFVLSPFVAKYVQPAFGAAPYGVSMFTAGLILSVMIIPYITAMLRELFRLVDPKLKEGALAIGATQTEMFRIAILGPNKSAIFGAVVLGFGRAIGETMAVTMVIGNRAQISLNPLEPAQTMASVIANEFAEASSDLHQSSLITIGLILLVISVVVNLLSRLLTGRFRKKASQQ